MRRIEHLDTESRRGGTAIITIAIDPGWDPHVACAGRIPAGLAITPPPASESVRMRFLDTFDWRVWEHGGQLALEATAGSCRLRWLPFGPGLPIAVPVAAAPRHAPDLPPGYLRERLAPVIAPRALLVMGELEVDRQRYQVTDDDGNTLLQLTVDRMRPTDDSGSAVDPLCAVLHATVSSGGESAAAALLEDLPTACDPGVPLQLAAAARGRHPGDYSSKLHLELHPAERADVALRHILGALLTTVLSNLDGTRHDLDEEFLHDLRVAMRRARSALSQLPGTVPRQAAERLATELKWVGTVTGPLRDLDVALGDLAGQRLMLPEMWRARLDPVEKHLRQARGRARGVVVRTLESRRFVRLIDLWRAVAAGDAGGDDPPAHAAEPIGAVAEARIHRAWKRIVKRGRRLGDDPPAQALHRLRIDAKKLRYLLEFFRCLYPAARIEPAIAGQKKLQDLLGSFNDLAVQRRRLVDDAQALLAGTDPAAETLLAIGRLEALLEARQEQLRSRFRRRFEAFAGHHLPTALTLERGGTA